ncbi:MAG: aminoglycoside phosphotransferase family protein [Saprospiraceae bacterium]|nr:aminoglycoside phosphotransferase family protein [Saprospiraceae bacterium]
MDRNAIVAIAKKYFKSAPREILHKTIGLCNEVYELRFDASACILRMNAQKDQIYGTHLHLPLFQQLQIRTPEIIAEDYSKVDFPFCYQVQTKLEGQDLGLVIDGLEDGQLTAIAESVSTVLRKFNALPKDATFLKQKGLPYSFDVDIWKRVVERKNNLTETNQKVGILNEEVLNIYDAIIDDHQEYFRQVKPGLFYDDINYKNVMVHEGRFNGIVDLDFLSIGDYVDAIGAMQACWFGQEAGGFYVSEMVRLLQLTPKEAEMVHVYAILHLILWSMEEGRQFNSNSSAEINWGKVREKRDKILNLHTLLRKA